MLKLPNDGPATGRLLSQVLTREGPAAIVRAIAEAQPPLMRRLAAGRLHGDPTEIVGVNDTGDKQKALDVGAHHHMIEVLCRAGVRQVHHPGLAADLVGHPLGRRPVLVGHQHRAWCHPSSASSSR